MTDDLMTTTFIRPAPQLWPECAIKPNMTLWNLDDVIVYP